MSLFQQMLHNPVGLLFIVIALGILIGQIPLGKFRLGGSGVLIIGLVMGHYGYLLPAEVQSIGVVLFVYAVGLSAGPHIMESLKKSKGSFFILAFVIVLAAGGVATVLKRFFGFPVELISGIYAGAMTSTPALAAAMETLHNATPSVGYGLAYPLGILGVIFMVQVLPLILKVNLAEEEKRYLEKSDRVKIERQCFQVTNPNVASLTIEELMKRARVRFFIARIKRRERIFTPQADDTLELHDLVLAVGAVENLEGLDILFGQRVQETVPQTAEAQSKWLIVSSRKFIGKKLGSLEIAHLYGVIITRVRRGEVEIVPSTNFVFEAGDEVRVSGSPADLHRFMKLVIQDRESVYETDIFSFALGLALGVLVGLIKIPLAGGLKIGLGIAGGPLMVGLLFGYMGRFGRITGHMPKAAKVLTGELGLYLFLAVAGTAAGEHFVAIFKQNGFAVILSGFLITLFPMLVATVVARLFFKMNLLVILGMICGGMTSTPALGVISSNTKSDIPALAYTGIYPVAVLLTTLMAQILVLF